MHILFPVFPYEVYLLVLFFTVIRYVHIPSLHVKPVWKDGVSPVISLCSVSLQVLLLQQLLWKTSVEGYSYRQASCHWQPFTEPSPQGLCNQLPAFTVLQGRTGEMKRGTGSSHLLWKWGKIIFLCTGC